MLKNNGQGCLPPPGRGVRAHQRWGPMKSAQWQFPLPPQSVSGGVLGVCLDLFRRPGSVF